MTGSVIKIIQRNALLRVGCANDGERWVLKHYKLKRGYISRGKQASRALLASGNSMQMFTKQKLGSPLTSVEGHHLALFSTRQTDVWVGSTVLGSLQEACNDEGLPRQDGH